MSLLKNILLAALLIVLILFLGKTFLPENALRIGTGFHRHTPALSYPMKAAFFSAFIFLVGSYFWEGKKLMTGYLILVGLNLMFLFYCFRTYVMD